MKNNMVGFLEFPSDMNVFYHQPVMWDRQTLVILIDNSERDRFMNRIRSKHKPSSYSCGPNYEIDVYTNIHYDIHESDPAMRNIRCVYCDNTMSTEVINNRFPNAYIICVEKGSEHLDRTQLSSGEIPKIDCN